MLVYLLFAAVAGAPPSSPPLWGSEGGFDVGVNISTGSGTYKWSFQYYSDYPGKQSAFFHDNKQHDEVCTLMAGHEKGNEECHVIFHGTEAYAVYPASGECCKDSFGAGMVLPTWLHGASYYGNETVQGKMCYGWLQQGKYANHFYATEDGIPCQYWETKPKAEPTNVPGVTVGQRMNGDPPGRKQWDFDMASYHARTQNPDNFIIPSNCKKCGFSAPTIGEIARAAKPKPTHFLEDTFSEMNNMLNQHLKRTEATFMLKPCSDMSSEEVFASVRAIYDAAHPQFQAIYKLENDNRGFSFDDWSEQEAAFAAESSWDGEVGGEVAAELRAMTKDGRCSQAVMYWTHHLSKHAKAQLAGAGFILPLLPDREHVQPGGNSHAELAAWATYQAAAVPCSTCHLH